MLKFFKTWTLPISMLAGAIGYFVFANVTFLEPTKPFMYTLIAYLTPFLIFAQLLLTFCKISVRELMPSPWHGWLLLIQAVSSLVLAALLLWLPMREEYRDVFEGAMVCLICPTATAAAVITGKLGGSASSLTTYTLLSNGSDCRAAGLPISGTACRDYFLRRILEDLGKSLPIAVIPVFPRFVLA